MKRILTILIKGAETYFIYIIEVESINFECSLQRLFTTLSTNRMWNIGNSILIRNINKDTR